MYDDQLQQICSQRITYARMLAILDASTMPVASVDGLREVLGPDQNLQALINPRDLEQLCVLADVDQREVYDTLGIDFA